MPIDLYLQVEDPIMIQGTEWLSVKLHGQSFMLHQIRKMICELPFLYIGVTKQY